MSSRQVVSSFSAFITDSFHVSDDDDFKQYLKISMVLSSLKINFTFVKSLIVAMLISTYPSFISGIWSLAPTSTMTRLRLQRAATESSRPTKTITEGQKRCSKGQNRDSQRQDRDSQGQNRDNQGQNRDNQEQNRDSQGQNRDRGIIGQTPITILESHVTEENT